MPADKPTPEEYLKELLQVTRLILTETQPVRKSALAGVAGMLQQCISIDYGNGNVSVVEEKPVHMHRKLDA